VIVKNTLGTPNNVASKCTWFISYLGNGHLTQTTLGLVGPGVLLRSV